MKRFRDAKLVEHTASAEVRTAGFSQRLGKPADCWVKRVKEGGGGAEGNSDPRSPGRNMGWRQSELASGTGLARTHGLPGSPRTNR